MPKVLVPLAEGFEELEAVTVIDLLRRAEVEVTTAGLAPGPVRGSRGTVLVPDATLDEALQRDYDMLVLPGGQPGATHLEQDSRVMALVKKMATEGRFMAAICVAPKVLAAAGVLDGKRATSYPKAIDPNVFPDVKLGKQSCVTDGKVVTSRGPGTAMDFALELIRLLAGRKRRDEVEAALQRPAEQALSQLADWG
ncbi:MAG: DJ-1 family glyoxalase III [Acidiferrobacterales bacterium]